MHEVYLIKMILYLINNKCKLIINLLTNVFITNTFCLANGYLLININVI